MNGLAKRTVIVILLSLWTACARVDPKHDFQRTGDMLAERTEAPEAYDPDTDAVVDARVAEILQDGLTIDEAVQVALLTNRGFQALFSSIGASRADVVQSGLLTNPSIGFMARFPEGGGRSNLTLTFAQELVDLWQIPVKRRIAEAQLEQTILDVARSGIDLAADVKKKFLQLATLERTEQIARENLDLVKQSIEIAQARLKAGETGQIDVNLLMANEIDVQTSLLSLSRDRAVAKADLGRVLGLARWKQPWKLTTAFEPSVMELPDDPTLIVFAMCERLEARMSAEKVRAAEAELERQYLNMFPSVSMGFEGERSERRALPGRKILADTGKSSLRSGKLTAPDIETRGERNAARRQIIDLLLGPSLQVTLPVWDQNQAQIAKARYRAQQTRKEYEDLLDVVSAEVQSATAVLTTSVGLMRFYDDRGLPTAKQNLELARKAYEVGEQNIVAVIEAQKFLIAQRLAGVNIRRDYFVAEVELRRALGGRTPPATATSSATTQPTDIGGAD